MAEDLKKITIYLNKGVNRDAPPGALAEGVASGLRHMRFDDDVCFKMPGIAVYYGAPLGQTQINGLFSFTGSDGVVYVLVGSIGRIGKIAGASQTVLSGAYPPTGALYDRWSFASWGNQVLLTNGVDSVKKFISPYSPDNYLPMTADANCPIAHTVRAYMRHVFLLDQPSYPFRVSWSDVDDYTDWTAVAGNDAGSQDLYESKTAVVGGETFKSIFVVYTGSQIHTFQYVGGTYVFARQIAEFSTGLWSRGLLVNTEEAQFFMSPMNFHSFDGIKQQPIGKGIRKEVFAGIYHAISSHSALIDYMFAFQVKDKNEVWFCVPTEHAYPDLAVIFNYGNGAFSLEDFAPYYAAAGVDQIPTANPLLALTDHSIYSLGSGENKSLVDGEVAYTGYIDSPEFDDGDPEAVKHILKIVPDITSVATTIGFRIGTRDTRNDTITWTPALGDAATSFDPNVDRHVDVRASGRLGRIRVETSALSSPFQVNKIEVYFVSVGGR